MYKYVTINGSVYVKTDRLTIRRIYACIITKCRHMYLSAYTLRQWIGGL